ncbi:Bromodomain-containing protein [Aureobasidium pullulans]|uniref:Bromodomain-containing protein n=1 Tax=Aureobasidium pullulans TaxID=5580 RepID=A0A4S8Z1T6_AURPU|nr:Bromodomain-containing protein [Aureobasidium pullulans]
MTSLAQHTPLESLLLLQALRGDGLTAVRFGQISEQLKGIPLIRNDPTYDSSRLDEDALKHLCLRLLKDEARNSLDQHEDRKRSQLSPSIPTVEEAAKHTHLIPRLIYRLYTRYREGIVAEIKNDEEKYFTAAREVGEIQRGQWDDRLRGEQAGVTAPTRQSPIDATQKLPTADVASQSNRAIVATAGQNAPVQVLEPARINRAKIDAVINHDPVATRPNISPTPPLLPSSSSSSQAQQYAPPAVPHRLSTTSLPPLSEMAPESPLPPHMQQSQPSPQLQSTLQSAPGYRVSPVLQQNGFPPQFARPNGQPSPRHSPAPSSPRPVLPLPPGMSLPPQPHSPALSNRGGPAQYPSPNQRLPPVPLQPATRAPHVHTPPTYHQPYPPYPQQPAHPQQQQHQQSQQGYPPRPPHQGGYQLPPFQVAAQDPSRMHQQHLTQQQSRQPPTPARQPIVAPYSPHTPYAYPAAQDPRRAENVNPLNILSSLRQTPRAILSRPGTPVSSARGATWKRERPSMLSRPFFGEIESPAPERITPPPPSRNVSPARTKEFPIKAKPTEDHHPQLEQEVSEPTPRLIKSARKSARRNRATSNASSAVASSVRARTRSQSVASHTESQTIPTEPSAVSRIVKDEPMTPADLLQEEILQAETSDPPSQQQPKNKRGRFMSNKRKRARSPTPVVPSSPAMPTESSEPEPGQAYGPPLKSKVQAHRNFARISNVIINDITQHKHAGPFQKPVREKDAEGYSDIIKRPQDLKSIKAAITFGSRAINAATSSIDSPAATPSSASASSVVLLDKTADLIPPKAIVNSSQLEKEVLRMFANAVMFNPGNDGIVQDAREMADDIEAKVRDWRQVEGAAANSSVRAANQEDNEDDGVGTGTGGDKKRRKL